MRYREILPGPSVRSFVERFWVLESEAGEPAEIQRVVPDGRPELILNFGEPFESLEQGEWRRQPLCFLAGQITRPLFLRPRGHSRILGIRFHPHGAGRLLGMPMQRVRDLAVPLSELSPGLARSLEPALDLLDMASVEAALCRAAGSPDELVIEAVDQIFRGGGRIDLGTLAGRLGISCRQLERRFERCVGLAPKLFARMQRFQRVFHHVEEGRPNWVEAAVACGYYDQAHLIRDFKDFSGQTPTALLAGGDLARHFMVPRGVSDFSKTPAGRNR